MSIGKVKHLFPGGNTSQGFFSFYANIIQQEEANHLFIIKGGPGVGKSTFMKKVGEALLQKGYDVEYLHCSSDNNSLDGVKIPALQIAFIDGTSPHVVDPKSPGAVDEILNFGAFWEEKGIRTHKTEIIDITRSISEQFTRAYKYLKSAYTIYEDCKVIYSKVLQAGVLNNYVNELVNEIFGDMKTSLVVGKSRDLFASAITPNGLCHYLEDIIQVDKIYLLKGGMGTGEQRILEKIKDAALMRGCVIECYYCALDPGKLEHLVIPEMSIGFTTANDYHSFVRQDAVSIDMQQFFDLGALEAYQDDLIENKIVFDQLLNSALNTIHRAKALHDQLETFYIPNIDFKAIDKCFDETMQRIRILEEKFVNKG